jgi:hypothetical protein
MISQQKNIPDFFITKRNTIHQVAFTALFAFMFINVYRPFGADHWYDVRWWMFTLASGLLVLSGMGVVILSRVIMFVIKRYKPITVLGYAAMVLAEILFMAGFYAILERVTLGRVRPFLLLYVVAVQNVSLILLIPYSLSLLYFSWKEKKVSLEALLMQIRNRPQFVSFKDENNVLRFTIKASNLLYLSASDNYVEIHYIAGSRTKIHLLRNTLKKIEEQQQYLPLLRCHRSFMVNLDQVKMFKREKGQQALWLDDEGEISIPVSRSYSKVVMSRLE